MAEELAKKAQAVVHKLVSGKDAPKGTEKMPLAELHQCAGLAFTAVKKAGVGITVEGGSGFVLAKLPGRGGRQSWGWSAPLYISLLSGGLGLTLGFSSIDSIIVLDTPEAVQAFGKSQATLDTNIGAAIGSALGAHLPVTDANFSDFALTEKAFTYSISEGVIVDCSLQGMRYAVDAKANATAYGEGATAEAILSGSVPAPAAFAELYAELDRSLLAFYAESAAAALADEAGAEPEAVGAVLAAEAPVDEAA